jgi:hypothetical protein
MQDSKKTLSAAINFMGPSIGPKVAVRLVGQVEDMNGALPDQLFSAHFPNGHRSDECSCAAVLGFHGLLELVGGDFGHVPGS